MERKGGGERRGSADRKKSCTADWLAQACRDGPRSARDRPEIGPRSAIGGVTLMCMRASQAKEAEEAMERESSGIQNAELGQRQYVRMAHERSAAQMADLARLTEPDDSRAMPEQRPDPRMQSARRPSMSAVAAQRSSDGATREALTQLLEGLQGVSSAVAGLAGRMSDIESRMPESPRVAAAADGAGIVAKAGEPPPRPTAAATTSESAEEGGADEEARAAGDTGGASKTKPKPEPPTSPEGSD